ncbi:GNAT family N-acetyltransferase, partial [Brachybacterium muris]|uniref:GNAT family N-acetyltransferase n=1 Tax=Brachybacterium muris TaxID=219301 RepID=UPI0021A53E06
PITIEDAVPMAAVLSGQSLYRFTGGEPPSVSELERRYTAQVRGASPDGREEWLNLVVVLEPEGKPIGYVQATIPRDEGPAEIAWVIGEPWQGHGHATRAAQLLIEHLCGLGVTDLIAHIHPAHVASQTVARRLGMVPTDTVIDGETRWDLALP